MKQKPKNKKNENNKLLTLLFIVISIALARVIFKVDFIPLDISLFKSALFMPCSILQVFILGLFSLSLKILFSNSKISVKNIRDSLLILLLFTVFRLWVSGGFDSLDQFLIVLNKPAPNLDLTTLVFLVVLVILVIIIRKRWK
jgi:hypothetical protein